MGKDLPKVWKNQPILIDLHCVKMVPSVITIDSRGATFTMTSLHNRSAPPASLRPISGRQCPTGGNTITNLIKHTTNGHITTSGNQCSQCKLKITTITVSSSHINSGHKITNGRPCLCCGKKITRPNNHTIHSSIGHRQIPCGLNPISPTKPARAGTSERQ